MKKWLLAVALSAACWSSPFEQAWKVRTGTGGSHSASAEMTYANAFLALCLAESGQTAPAQRLIAPYQAWLSEYPKTQDVHGQKEPAWIRGEADQAALVLLTMVALEKFAPSPSNREAISQWAQGLAMLRTPSRQRYPFGAHTSFDSARLDSPAYAPTNEAKAPGALWRPERSLQVRALAEASRLLGDKSWLEEAQSEALGIWSHLVTSNRWVWAFVPRPTGTSEVLAPAAAVDNLLTLSEVTGQQTYALLAGLAARQCLAAAPQNETEKLAQQWVRKRTLGNEWLTSKDLSQPLSYQIMEAEDGKAVQKAFDVLEVSYPNGQPGKMVRVGRDQMFWMRFDIEREDDYFFHLIFLKSRLEGGLVSVKMRIDGDKIFQVNLGGASDPYVDMDWVDGPRPLRAGPHSFGLRFSGLLMTVPAVLDSVLAWPVVERREFQLANRQRVLLLHNNSDKSARTSLPTPWPPRQLEVLNAQGLPAQVSQESDRRRRKEYLVLPPGGLVWAQWQE